jgi:hypothetical protein
VLKEKCVGCCSRTSVTFVMWCMCASRVIGGAWLLCFCDGGLLPRRSVEGLLAPLGRPAASLRRFALPGYRRLLRCLPASKLNGEKKNITALTKRCASAAVARWRYCETNLSVTEVVFKTYGKPFRSSKSCSFVTVRKLSPTVSCGVEQQQPNRLYIFKVCKVLNRACVFIRGTSFHAALPSKAATVIKTSYQNGIKSKKLSLRTLSSLSLYFYFPLRFPVFSSFLPFPFL